MRILLLVLSFFLCGKSAYAVCIFGSSSLSVQSTLNFNGDNYDSFSPTQVIEAVTVEVTTSGGGCNYYVTATPGSSGDDSNREMQQGSNVLSYNLYSDAGATNILRDIALFSSEDDVIAGSFPLLSGEATNVHTLYVSVPPLQTAPPSVSRYSDQVTIGLYQLVLGLPVLQGNQQTFTIRTFVNSQGDVLLVDTGQSFNISDTSQVLDFGVIAQNDTQTADMIVRSNNGYDISLQSANGQVLVHENAPTVTDTISYGLSVDSVSKDLTSGSPVSVATGSGFTSVSGTRLPVMVTAGDPANKAAGQYGDDIMVTVTSN